MKMILKKYMLCLLAVCLLLAALPLNGFAAEETEPQETEALEVRRSSQCGEDLTWDFDGGTLTISGNGDMDDYPDGDAPWLEYKDDITAVVFTGNVTSVGACAFMDYDNLASVDFGSAMHTIHYRAFKFCDGLTRLELPVSFRRFGEESFMSCKSLTEIRCAGGMPSFNMNCLWDTYVSVFYPSNNPWPSDLVMQLFQAFQGRVQFFMGGETEVIPVETTQPPTQPQETEPQVTEQEETEPETVETVPVTEETAAATEPEETQQTVPETTEAVTEMTEPEWLRETEEPREEPGKNVSGIWFGLFLITGTLSLVLIGALLFRRRSW